MSRKSSLAREDIVRLEQLPNVGAAIAEDLRSLGIAQPTDLEGRDAYAMYDELCRKDAVGYDPCLLDVFLAAVDFANGAPSTPWWKYTPQRKQELARREQERRKASQGVPAAGKRLGRRALLINGAAVLLASHSLRAATAAAAKSTEEKDALRFTLLTDLHYADKPSAGSRHYRETLTKLKATHRAANAFKPSFVVELGDVIDAADSVEREKQYLKTIHERLTALPGENHYVVGNHCVYWLTKPEFLEVVGQPKTYYSFDAEQFHFVVLDGCFRSDGEPYGRKNFEWTDSNLSQDELTWLAADLKNTQLPTIVFVHQRLDVTGNHGIKNAPQARRILENSGNVLAVFQGHNHKNDYRDIGGIHYCTLKAMVEGAGPKNNAFANVSVDRNGTIHVQGFVAQKSYDWAPE